MMDRRTLLKLIPALAVAGCGQRPKETGKLRVVVAGAGIVGASIAYHLAKSGASVTVIDAAGPATHASRGTFAWINATWAKQPRHYHALNQDSVADWRELQVSLNIPVRWGGSLEWFTEPARTDALTDQIAEQVAWGEPASMLSAAELTELEPGLKVDSGVRAAFSPNDGAVDPVLATRTLLLSAERLGATVQYPSAITAVRLVSGRLTGVETTSGSIAADRLVLATGAAEHAPRDFAGIVIPQRSTPGVIAITRPLPRMLNRVVAAPGVHMHQRSDGRVVLGEQDGAPDNEAHAVRLQGRPNDFPADVFAQQHADRMLGIAKSFLPDISGAEVESVYIGWRPLPLDGHPVLGSSPARPDVYLAIMHSGVSLAPIVGQLLASEITNDMAIPRLDEYRPDREFERITRY
jgi:glycine/D-amino acid oxidase-like deaminating enzyme